MKIATDSKMDFDYSVATEDRFALRRWWEELVEAINYNDRGVYASRLYDNLVVEGFGASSMGKAAFLDWLADRAKQNTIHVSRFPALSIKFRLSRYELKGTYEEFVDGLLSYEGTVEILVIKDEAGFKLATLKFFPRMKPAEQPHEIK